MKQPPKLARKLFERVAGPAFVDDLLGDLDELFLIHLKTKSPRVAQWLYWRGVLSLLFSYTLRKRKQKAAVSAFSVSTFSVAMIASYLKVAARSLYQHKYFTVLNAAGLAIGMSVSLLLIAMYSYVSTYDSFHENKARIYSITSSRTEGIETTDLASAPATLAYTLKNEFAGADEVVRIYASFGGEVELERENMVVRGYYTDSNFLSVFTFPLLHGQASSALARPNTIVLTESTAYKLFATTDVLGKTLPIKDQGSFEITGVMRDYPKNTHFKFEALASYSSLPAPQVTEEEGWTNYRNHYVYVLLNPLASEKQLDHYLQQTASRYGHLPVNVALASQPLQEIVTSEHSNSIGPKWETSGFIVFGVICLLILLPACFNYTNISIARALKRCKEIGLRKTLGGMKVQIFTQFLTETILISALSLIGAWGIFLIIRAEFQSMMVEASTLDLSITTQTATLFLTFALFTGLLAGVFPALHFAGLNPIQALKNKTTMRGRAMTLRKGLTVLQFALSFCFMLSLIVFGRQYHTVLNFDFGFQKENIVTVKLHSTQSEVLKTEFATLAAVKSVSLSSALPGLAASYLWVRTDTDSVQAQQLFVDENFVPNFGFTLVHGQNFPAFTGREQFVLVNEQFLINSKIPLNEATSKIVSLEGKELAILGVVKNFTYTAPHLPIGNFIFRMDPHQFAYASLLVDSQNPYELFSAIETKWKSVGGKEPLEAAFFESELNESFSIYKNLVKIAGFLGLLAISVSVLGLLGMVVFSAETKLKEMSVRKVLGASAFSIMVLLSKEYLQLLGWAILVGIALAIGIYEFVFTRIPDYQTDLRFTDVLLGAIALLTLGLFTIASQTRKTASANPAEILRTE
ncbi:MAG: ABC transporter permease [Cytophagales bacterium]|nr:ABC transporter permease [Cytophagales bacterium]